MDNSTKDNPVSDSRIYTDMGVVNSNLYELKPITTDDSLHKNDESNLSKHNDQYTKLLEAYVSYFEESSKEKNNNKKDLFNVSKRLLFWIPLAIIFLIFISLYCLATNRLSSLELIPGMITAMTTLIGTFLVIPKMITKYLFNKNEENHLANIISKIQEYDRNIRDGL